MRMKIMVLILAVLTVQVAFAESAGIEYSYTCRSCGTRFMGYVVQAGSNRPGSKERIEFKGQGMLFDFDSAPDDEFDSDYARIFTGLNKYAFGIITCPQCGFAFLHSHYYSQSLSEEVKQKIAATLKPQMTALKKELRRKLIIPDKLKDEAVNYDLQNQIPFELKYSNAIECYRWQHYSPAFIARLALNGAWAHRVEICKPFVLADKEFNKALQRMDERMAKYRDALKKADERNSRARNEQLRLILIGMLETKNLKPIDRFVIYNILIGLGDRQGRFAEARSFLALARTACGDDPRLEAYLDGMQKLLEGEARFTRMAIDAMLEGLAAQAYSRTEIAPLVYQLAEGYKRVGSLNRAHYWFELLKGMDDASEMIRANAGVRLDEIRDITLTGGAGDAVSAEDTRLGGLIRNGLGTIDACVREGLARRGLEPAVCEKLLRSIGAAILVFRQDHGYYPDTLQELWDTKTVTVPAAVNYFCCPVTGLPFRYEPARTGFMVWPLLCDSHPHPWSDAVNRFGIFHSNGLFKIEDQLPAELGLRKDE